MKDSIRGIRSTVRLAVFILLLSTTTALARGGVSYGRESYASRHFMEALVFGAMLLGFASAGIWQVVKLVGFLCGNKTEEPVGDIVIKSGFFVGAAVLIGVIMGPTALAGIGVIILLFVMLALFGRRR